MFQRVIQSINGFNQGLDKQSKKWKGNTDNTVLIFQQQQCMNLSGMIFAIGILNCQKLLSMIQIYRNQKKITQKTILY